jgi:predicted Zn-dependent protease
VARRRSILALLIAGLVALAPMPSFAQGEAGSDSKKKDEKGRRAPPVDAQTGKRLNEAVELLNAGKYGDARATLQKLSPDRLSPYEQSRVFQLLAAVEQAEENYDGARSALEKALASGGLADVEISSTRFQIAQLYMAQEKWREGIKALEEWFKITPQPNSAAYYLLAIAHYQLNELGKALEPAQKAVDLSGDKPQVSWLELLLALRMEREEYALAAPLLRRLIALAPEKKQYWTQLSQVYAAQGDMKQAAIPLQLAYHQGLISTENELRRLSEILLQSNIPFRAARTLTTAIDKKAFEPDVKTLELLGQAWLIARSSDEALKPLTKAAQQSGKSDLYLRLAEVYAQREDWPNAQANLKTALDKGDLKSPGSAQLLMGIVLYSQEKYGEARGWFERARGTQAQRAQADNWLKYIEQARKRAAEEQTS